MLSFKGEKGDGGGGERDKEGAPREGFLPLPLN